MTSLDRDPITSPPTLDPSTYNSFMVCDGVEVDAYYSPLNKGWIVYTRGRGSGTIRSMPGIDATDWPEVWREIISKEQGS